MDITPFLQPGFLLSFFGAVITLVIWSIRLESKTKGNEKDNQRLENEFKDLRKEVKDHRENQEIHFDERITKQVDKANEHRFETIEKQLGEINHKIDTLIIEKK